MSLIKFLTFVSFAILAHQTLHAAPRCPGNVASLPLRLVQNSVIVVPVQINGSGPYDFVVDTGAQVTTVDSSLASELHLKTEGVRGVSGVATYARSAFAYLGLLQAGADSVSNSLVVIQELRQLKAADPRISGILGGTFLEHFDILIDNRQRLLCLDDSNKLAVAIKGEHLALVDPRGSQEDLPFTRPMIVAARLPGFDAAPVLLRLDSGSNVPLLYTGGNRLSGNSSPGSVILRRNVNGTEQEFVVLPAQDVQVGRHVGHQISFVVPRTSIGNGPAPREDGLLPTLAFQRVFISSSRRYVALDPW
jgi:hypothetical protein